MPTKIEWADETWNPVTGCTKVSAGCANCYAETMAGRFAREGQHAKRAHRTTPRPSPGKLGRMFRCGKKNAGRLLDGELWDLYPKGKS